MAQPFVSVLTPTYNRRKFLPIAIACFKAQDYPKNRMEWIILDDGTDKVGDIFEEARVKFGLPIRYIAVEDGVKLPIGAKRNRLNELTDPRCEIVVPLDDDDYYPPSRIKKAVTKLRSVKNKQVPVVGCSRINLFFSDRNEIWSIGPYAQNHCTNGTMAYWRSYFDSNRYEDHAEKAEEKHFLRGFTTPVLQLNPDETMLVICHADNTYDKRNLLKQKNPLLKRTTLTLKTLIKDREIRDFYIGLARDYAEKDKVTEESTTTTTTTLESATPSSSDPEQV